MVFTKGSVCSAINCSNNKKKTPHLSFFRFPQEPERIKKWLINSRREDLMDKDAAYLRDNVKFCSLHFEANQFMNDEHKKLVWNAVPTLFDVPNKPPKLTMKRKLPHRRDSVKAKNIKMCPETSITTAVAASSQLQSLEPHTGTCECSTQTSFEDEIIRLNNIIRILQKRVKCKNVQILRLRSKLLRQKESAYRNKNRQQTCKQVQKDKLVLQTIGSRYLKKEAIHLLSSQVCIPLNGKRGVRWTVENKLFALKLLYYSTQAYNFLSECFLLPSVRTLQRYVEAIHIKCGINDNIFHLLKQKTQHFSETDRIVNLCMDEMSLMANLMYESSTDCVIGFEDMGYTRTPKFANSVLVLMVNGIFSNFKQPLLYYFCKGSVGATHLSEIFYDVHKRLTEIGLVVKTCVTDQGSNFVDWRHRLGITTVNPSIDIEGKKIYFFYDTPHLIKSIRNNLFRYSILHNSSDGWIGAASWKDISQLYVSDCDRKYKLAPKLTKKAIQLPAFSKMKVSSAVRVLSHTVAAGIETLIACGTMPSSASATADFCKKVNDIFDVFNTFSTKGPVALRNCVTTDSQHIKILQTLKPWIESWKFIDNDGKDCSSRIKCVKGLLSNVSALEMFVDEVLAGKKLYLLTRKINQDVLENFFSVIRHKGGFCSNPSPRQFCAAFNNCALSKLMCSSSMGSSNCEGIDWGQAILDIKAAKSLPVTPLLGINDKHSVMCLPNVEVPTDIGEANSMRYVFGYILKKLFAVHSCNTCRSVLVDSSQDLDSGDKVYCHFKSFKDNFGSLFICSESVRTFFIDCENQMSSVFYEHAHKSNCGALFVSLLMDIPNFPTGCCAETKLLLITLFVKVRLFYILKFINQDMLSSNKKNIKLMKLTHEGC